MDEEALVTTLAYEGAQLAMALRRDSSRLTELAVVARDLDSGDWYLLLPLPRESSRLSSYEAIQQAIVRSNLALPLERIVLVRDGDPGLRELRDGAAVRYPAPRSLPVEVAGRRFSEAVRVRVEPELIEQQVKAVIASTFPEAQFLDPNEVLSPRAVPVLRGHRPFDLAVALHHSLVLIEVKAQARPISSVQFLATLGALTFVQRSIDRPVKMILVTAGRYIPSDAPFYLFDDDFAIVRWGGSNSAYELSDTFARLTGSG